MPKTIHITDFPALKRRVDELKNRSEDIKGRVGPVLKQLWDTERSLAKANAPIDLNGLRLDFPQFKEVIDTIDDSLWLSNLTDSHFSIPPLLLNGEPGLGKTYFASRLAETLGLPYFEVSLATMSASFELIGSSLHWSESAPGTITKFIAESEVANPIILVDELDKSGTEGKYPPANVLYGLLEPHSAKRFKDEALNIEIDVSHVNWILTSNYSETISAPLLSRMHMYDIQLPEVEEMKVVVQRMYHRYRSESGLEQYLDDQLGGDVQAYLATCRPREVRMQLITAAIKALKRGGKAISMDDLPQRKEVGRVGFY